MTSPALLKTWNSVMTELSEYEDQEAQYQEVAYTIKQRWVDQAGWTVFRSCDGVQAASASDQWTGPNVLIHGNSGDPFSWIVFQSPTGWDTNPIYMLFALSEGAAVSPPQIASLIGATTPFTGGDQINTPTATAGTFQITETQAIVPWTDPRRGLVCTWTTSDGDYIVGVKRRGRAGMDTSIMMRSSGGISDGGRGNRRALYRFYFAIDQAFSVDIVAGTIWHRWRANGDTGAGLAGRVATGASLMNWTRGEIFPPGQPMWPGYFCSVGDNVNPGDSRYLGLWTDVFFGYRNISGPGGDPRALEVRDGDTSAVRYALVGSLWLPTVAAQLPIP